MSRIRVVFLTSSMKIGGQEQYIAQQIQHLDQERFEPLLCCLKDAGPLAEAVRAAGIPLFSGFQRFKYDAGALVRLTRFLLHNRPSVLYIFDFRNVLFIGRLAARLARIPVCVIACHKMNWKGSGRSYTSWLDRLLMPLADHVVAAADAHRAALIEKDGLPAAKVSTIHNGIDLSRLERDAAAPVDREALGVPPGCPIIGLVGRLSPEKSHQMFLSAMPRILAGAPTAHAVFVGEGPCRRDLEARAGELGLASCVHFLGAQPHVASILAHCDVFALTSSTELFSAATLEAMAFGLPVVVTDVGGMREMVVDGVTGLLVPPNEPAAFADAVVLLLARPDLRAGMGKAGAERVRARFTAEREARDLGNLLEQLLASSARNRSRRATRRQTGTGDEAIDSKSG